MKQLSPIIALVCALWTTTALAQEARTIAAVNAPLAYFARELAGDGVTVVYPLPSDVDLAYWAPTDDDILQFQQADLILLNGAGYAGWTKQALLPRARLVDTSAGIRDLLIPTEKSGETHKHGPEGEHAHDGDYAITTWLDPKLATAQMEAAADAIAARWPDLEAEVNSARDALRQELSDADATLRAYFEGLGERQILASHPVYQYLDRAYDGAIQSLHWEPDSDPGEAEWQVFSEQLAPDRRPLMLWEDTPLPKTAERLNALGVEIVVLNPMGNTLGSEPLFETLANQVPVSD